MSVYINWKVITEEQPESSKYDDWAWKLAWTPNKYMVTTYYRNWSSKTEIIDNK